MIISGHFKSDLGLFPPRLPPPISDKNKSTGSNKHKNHNKSGEHARIIIMCISKFKAGALIIVG